MNKEELKNKCKERAKIFQQAMESCKSSNPMDCIEWFADRIAELEAGRPQWHKVADGDLPNDNRTVLDEAGDRFYYFKGHFYYESDSRFDCQPIAWCEIPTFDKE